MADPELWKGGSLGPIGDWICLDGFVYADHAQEALDAAITLAEREWPETSQADEVDLPRPVINAEEIVEVKGELNGAEEGVELFWDGQENS